MASTHQMFQPFYIEKYVDKTLSTKMVDRIAGEIAALKTEAFGPVPQNAKYSRSYAARH